MFQLKWMWKYMGKKRHYFVIGLIIACVTSVASFISPMLSQRLIDEVITPENPDPLVPILLTLIGVQLARTSLRYLMIVLVEQNSQEMYDGLRKRLFHVIQNEDYKFFRKMRTGDLMTRMTNDLDLVRHGAAWIAHSTIDAVVLFTTTMIFFFTIHVEMTLWLCIVTPGIFFITYFFSKIIKPMYVKVRRRLSELNTVAQENIEGNRVVKAFAREEFEKERFKEKNEEFRQMNLKATYVAVKFQPFIDFLSQCLTVITILVGGIFMINGEITAGNLLAISTMTWALATPLKMLGTILNDTQRFFASANMIIEVFYAEPSIVNRKNAIAPKERAKGEVEFKNVDFTINRNPILKDISFHIKPGETLGIMGTTGSGKTSIVSTLLRFYEPQSGEVSLDGKNIQDYTLSYLRNSLGVAFQDVFLFSDSVDMNIAYNNPEIPVEDVYKFAKIADADSFIKKMDDGYDTIVGERGVGLSGGQRQRISLARALAVKPSVLVLDDTTSAVDSETEQYIQEQIKNLDFECSKIIIAQRVSSIQHAKEIIILDKGEIIERGTHSQLLAKKGFYYHIWALQNNVEEGGEIDG
ncbi:MAG: ABC transporter ATP-binding protein [Clostridia bacterium]